VGLLGSGGMGDVYVVQHPRLPRKEALKLLNEGVSRNEEFRRRFLREADLLALQCHPNIVTVYDRGEHDGRLWLAMELVDGQDCAKLLRSRGRLSLELTSEIMAGAAAALDYAYSHHRVIHRDVKPANILVDLGHADVVRSVKLADFGIAKAAGESTTITSAGVAVGTMAYVSPEAIEGRDLDNRADLYALACTAFEMLTGLPPYSGGSLTALISAHLSESPPAITGRNEQLPRYLNAVFERALAKEPNARFDTCAEFVAALRTPAITRIAVNVPEGYPAWADTVSTENAAAFAPTQRAPIVSVESTSGTSSKPAPSTSGRNRRWLWVASAAAAVAVLTGSVIVVNNRDSVVPESITESAAPAEHAAPSQTILPFSGLDEPVAVAVDTRGHVYAADRGTERVVMLATGSGAQQVVPFAGLDGLTDMAIDGNGSVYALDFPLIGDAGRRVPRVVMLSSDFGEQTTVPLSGVRMPGALAVDAAGNLYVADTLPGGHIVMVAAGTNIEQTLPLTTGDGGANGLAVDSAGNLYLSTITNDRVVMWTASTGQQRALPFQGLGAPRGLAIDSAGRIMVADQRNNRVVTLDVASGAQQEVPLVGLNHPASVAIGTRGSTYVADTGNKRIVQVAAS